MPIAPRTRYNRGDGLRMATALGAGTAGQFDMAHCELIDRRTTKADAVIYGHTYGIVVNDASERFFDEGERPFGDAFEAIAYETWRSQGGRAYFIGDQSVRDVDLIAGAFTTDLEPETGETLEALAAALGLDPGALAATVDAFNAACPEGRFDATVIDGRSTRGLVPPKSNWAQRIDRAPFLGYPLESAVTFTFGGLRTDAVGRVLTDDGKILPNLYAAGEVTGLYYHEYPPATSVLRALTFGRLAGHHAARKTDFKS